MSGVDRPGTALSRRDLLKAAGLSLGALSGAGLACGRTGREAAPAPTSPPAVPTASQPTVVSIVASPSPMLGQTVPPELAADLVLLNGKVITVDPGDTTAQAVAVKDGLIQAVGTDAQIGALVGPDTQSIDAGGRAVTPGLIDPHNHFQVMGQMSGFYIPFMPPDVRTIEELQSALAEWWRRHPRASGYRVTSWVSRRHAFPPGTISIRCRPIILSGSCNRVGTMAQPIVWLWK